uniref:Uncharacterized protein n=1 Tax=viral metagenome TaxID=1070528 RepID=A0A6C0HBF3_9ZZZZ
MDKINKKIDDITVYHSVRLVIHHIICAIEEYNEPEDILTNNSIWRNVPDNFDKPKSNKHISFHDKAQEYIIPNCRNYLTEEERQRIWYTSRDYTIMQKQASHEVFSYMCAYPTTNYRHCIKKLWTEYDFIPSE